MNDQDYIRKAVELADGWKLESLGEEEPQHIEAHNYYLGHLTNTDGRHPGFRNVALDALAAEIVRQYYKKRPKHYPLTHEADPMITIRDIVDSKVLE